MAFTVSLQELMTNEGSPVLDYYPVNFRTDLNGKQQDWEAVVLIPFIEEVNFSQGRSEKMLPQNSGILFQIASGKVPNT